MTTKVLDYGAVQFDLLLEYGSIVDAATGGAITNATTSVKVSSLELWVQTRAASVNDTSNSAGWSGSSVVDGSKGSTSFVMGNNETLKVATLTPEAWAITFGAASGASFAASLTGVEVAGDLSGTHTFSAPARPYSAPATPTVGIGSGTVSVSGNQLTASSDKFWANQHHAMETNGVWAADVNYAGDRTAYTFTTAADSRYRARVRALNANATGSYGYSDYWYTTPDAVTGLTASRAAGSTTVNLAWTNNARYSGTIRIQRSLNGAAYAALKSVTGTSTSTTDTVPLGSTASYRIYVDTPQGENKVTSAVSTTASIGEGYNVPNAPTVSLSRVNDTSGTITISGNQNTATSDRYWDGIQYEIAVGTGAYGGTTALAGNTTSVSLSGWTANNRYRVRVRSVNSAGTSAWVESGYVYTTPSAPTGGTGTRQATPTSVVIDITGAGTFADLILVERSTNSGSSWTSLGSFAPTATFTDNLGYGLGWYRLRAQTPAPVIQSAYSATIIVEATFPTDTSKIPGVTRIYTGSTRVRQVYKGTTRFWTDGEA